MPAPTYIPEHTRRAEVDGARSLRQLDPKCSNVHNTTTAHGHWLSNVLCTQSQMQTGSSAHFVSGGIAVDFSQVCLLPCLAVILLLTTVPTHNGLNGQIVISFQFEPKTLVCSNACMHYEASIQHHLSSTHRNTSASRVLLFKDSQILLLNRAIATLSYSSTASVAHTTITYTTPRDAESDHRQDLKGRTHEGGLRAVHQRRFASPDASKARSPRKNQARVGHRTRDAAARSDVVAAQDSGARHVVLGRHVDRETPDPIPSEAYRAASPSCLRANGCKKASSRRVVATIRYCRGSLCSNVILKHQ